MTEREKLTQELNKLGFSDSANCCVYVEDVVDFVIKDRERICKPLINILNKNHISFDRSMWAIGKTLELSGLGDEK